MECGGVGQCSFSWACLGIGLIVGVFTFVFLEFYLAAVAVAVLTLAFVIQLNYQFFILKVNINFVGSSFPCQVQRTPSSVRRASLQSSESQEAI